MTFYQRRAYEPMPHDRRFRLRTASGFMVVQTTSYAVEVEYFSKPAQAEAEWKMYLDLDHNPGLEHLYHRSLGWDLPGLCMLLWRYPLDGTGDGTVMRPSHLGLDEENRRSEAETTERILSVLSGSEQPMTRRQIASALGRAKAPRIIQQLESLVKAGQVERVETQLKNGKKLYLYRM